MGYAQCRRPLVTIFGGRAYVRARTGARGAGPALMARAVSLPWNPFRIMRIRWHSYVCVRMRTYGG